MMQQHPTFSEKNSLLKIKIIENLDHCHYTGKCRVINIIIKEKAKLFYMDTDSFIVFVKTNDIYKDIQDVEERFDTSNYELERSPSNQKNKKFIA